MRIWGEASGLRVTNAAPDGQLFDARAKSGEAVRFLLVGHVTVVADADDVVTLESDEDVRVDLPGVEHDADMRPGERRKFPMRAGTAMFLVKRLRD